MRKTSQPRIVITAGSCWVQLDRVRVVTNIFTGYTGLQLANAFARKGFKVTCLLGPGGVQTKRVPQAVRIRTFRYFDELQNLLREELSDVRYTAVIHSAAVSDYRPRRVYNGKMSSGKKKLTFTLVPNPENR